MWAIKKVSKSNLLLKLVFLNSMVILLVILFAGLSVKNYACFLVNSEDMTGQVLVHTLDGYLFKVSVLAFFIAGLFHYITVKKIIKPIKQLSSAAKEIKERNHPTKVHIAASGEMKDLIENFNSMADTLHKVQEQREEMLRDIAHELRTPLTNINGYLEALQNKVIEGNSELFGSLLEESRRITGIVELITELNSWNNGVYFLEKPFEHVEIDKTLSESIKVFHLRMEDKFSETSFQIESGIIEGNKNGLMQVFTNIFQNILDYNAGDKLEVTGQINNDQYLITFSHIGQSIVPEKKDLIFERFYRLDESRSTRSSGAGLGLAIAKSIISAHRGHLGLDTDGTSHTFWIKLPLIKK